MERGGAQVALDRLVAPQLDAFTAPVFEEICRQFLWRLGLAGGLSFLPLRIGGWWRANEEVDAVAVGQDGALLVECKWTSRPIGADILRNLERKGSLVSKELGSRQLFFGLCARGGFTPQVEEEAARRDDLFLFDLPRIAG